MDKIELYYDHYKETYKLSKKAQDRRNKFFVVLCIMEALSFMLLIKPEEMQKVFVAGINTHFETEIFLGNGVIQTLLWILVAYVTVRYCQDVLYVERQYLYLEQLEMKIAQECNASFFGREGEQYLRDYPIVLNLVDLFYKFFCPVLFTGVNIVHIIQEWKNCTWTLALGCDTAIFGVIFIITWFYFFEIHSKIASWFKRHIPLLNTISVVIKKILKEV